MVLCRNYEGFELFFKIYYQIQINSHQEFVWRLRGEIMALDKWFVQINYREKESIINVIEKMVIKYSSIDDSSSSGLMPTDSWLVKSNLRINVFLAFTLNFSFPCYQSDVHAF